MYSMTSVYENIRPFAILTTWSRLHRWLLPMMVSVLCVTRLVNSVRQYMNRNTSHTAASLTCCDVSQWSSSSCCHFVSCLSCVSHELDGDLKHTLWWVDTFSDNIWTGTHHIQQHSLLAVMSVSDRLPLAAILCLVSLVCHMSWMVTWNTHHDEVLNDSPRSYVMHTLPAVHYTRPLPHPPSQNRFWLPSSQW